MPFTVGPFEPLALLLIIAIIGFSLFVAYIMTKGSTERSSGTISDVKTLDDLIAEGWRIESESSDYVFLVRGQRVNHLLHFLVGLFTASVWWIVWIFIAARGGQERQTIKQA